MAHLSQSALNALLADNTAGDISAADMRSVVDTLYSGMPVYDLRKGEYGVVADGVTDDGPAIRAAITAAEAAGYGRLILPAGPIRIASTETDANGDTCGLAIQSSRIELVGQGRGSGRSGSVDGDKGVTTLVIDVACEHGVMMKSSNGNPDWRGGGIKELHIQDGGNFVTNDILGIQGLLDFRIYDVSLAGARATNAKGLRVFPSNNGEPTQYGRSYNLDIWDCFHGAWFESNAGGNPVAPDWKMIFTQIQAQANAAGPVDAGSIGLYVNSNAFHYIYGEIQNFDTGVVIDQANGRGKHIEICATHFEMEASAPGNSYTAAIEIRSHTSPISSNILIADCECPSPGKYETTGSAPSGAIIKVTGTPANVDGTRIRDWRIRDFGGANAWITPTNATSFIDGGGTFDCEIYAPTATTSL